MCMYALYILMHVWLYILIDIFIGKNIKRKDKKTNNKLQKSEKQLKGKKRKTKITNITTNKTHNNKTVCKIGNNRKLDIIYSSINKKRNKKKSNKNNKTKKVTHKLNDYNEHLLRKFKEETKSIQKRCQKLSHEVQCAFQNRLFNNKMNEFNTKQIIDLDCNHNSNFNMDNKLDLQHSKIEDQNTLNKEINVANNSSIIELKTSYDLLKTADIIEKSHMNIFSKDKNTVIEEIGESCK